MAFRRKPSRKWDYKGISDWRRRKLVCNTPISICASSYANPASYSHLVASQPKAKFEVQKRRNFGVASLAVADSNHIACFLQIVCVSVTFVCAEQNSLSLSLHFAASSLSIQSLLNLISRTENLLSQLTINPSHLYYYLHHRHHQHATMYVLRS